MSTMHAYTGTAPSPSTPSIAEDSDSQIGPPLPPRIPPKVQLDGIDATSPPRKSPCVLCNSSAETWMCVPCEEVFCDGCWATQLSHKPGKRGHEKTNEDVLNRHNHIFAQLDPEKQRIQHENDVRTTWLGYEQNGSDSFLNSSTRLYDVLQEGRIEDSADRFPSLVSFVGQTGAGKSTVIKLLIDHQQVQIKDGSSHPTPVPSRISDNIPTTGNVHLYEDPATFFQNKPILYADCEGMAGGENLPLGLVQQKRKPVGQRTRNVREQQGGKRLRERILWAENPQMRTREYAVTTLFPRVLYTFSDVVVFVLREVRTFQSDVLQRLVNWAAMSFDKSINQPSLPHIVIVLNATDSGIDQEQWDVEAATRQLLEDYKDSVHQVHGLREICSRLKEQGKDIQTTTQLLEHYYTSVTVLRIPTKRNYMRTEEQIGQLYKIIQSKTAESYAHKKKVRVLLDADKFPQYINAACRHFAKHIDAPFDFTQEARQHMSPPRNFGGHILNLVLSIYNNSQRPWGDAHSLFTKLARPVASSVMLAAMRDNTQGDYSSLLRNTYHESLSEAFQTFCTHWLRCSYQKRGEVCVNTMHSHLKDHQARSGTVLARGPFESRIHALTFFPAWIEDIDQNIRGLDKQLQELNVDEKVGIPRIHQAIMERFYQECGSAGLFRAHLTCLCCVRKVPSNPLPCGHVLCDHCVQMFGTDHGRGLIEMPFCPLHPLETSWSEPAQIRFKPQEAGVRALCLDGGGVRCMVQILMLQALEEALGGMIPIQSFFDLIVGTGTGGIIALGLGVEHWTVSNCIDRLRVLFWQAFDEPKPLAGLGQNSYYKAQPLRDVLLPQFNDKSRLYGDYVPQGRGTRVAVASTLVRESQPAILSNYNREGRGVQTPYRFVRARDSATELRTWEVARAATATQPYFKPVVQTNTLTVYADRGTQQPSSAVIANYERWCIWGDDVCSLPDIFLSLGTGISQTGKISRPQPQTPRLSSSIESDPMAYLKASRSQWRTLSLGRWLADPVAIDDESRHEQDWRQYCERVTAAGDAYARVPGHSRNERLNVSFPGERPQFDEVAALETMEQHVRRELSKNPAISRLAQRLVGSCFYFERRPSVRQKVDTGTYECFGHIRCRFTQGSANLKGLGLILRRYIGKSFVPLFYLQENFGSISQKGRKVDMPVQTIKDMCDSGIFHLPTDIHITAAYPFSETNVSLCCKSDDACSSDGASLGSVESLVPISGFPRKLFAGGRAMPVKSKGDLVGEAIHKGVSDLAVPTMRPGSFTATTASDSIERKSSIEKTVPKDMVPKAFIPDGSIHKDVVADTPTVPTVPTLPTQPPPVVPQAKSITTGYRPSIGEIAPKPAIPGGSPHEDFIPGSPPAPMRPPPVVPQAEPIIIEDKLSVGEKVPEDAMPDESINQITSGPPSRPKRPPPAVPRTKSAFIEPKAPVQVSKQSRVQVAESRGLLNELEEHFKRKREGRAEVKVTG